MVASSRTNTKSIRTLPKWVWRLGIAYMGVTLITYIGAFPIRYNQLLTTPDLTPFLASVQAVIEFLLVIVTTIIGFTLMLRRQNEAIATLMAVVIMVGPPNVTAFSHLSTPLHPLMYIPSGIVLTTVTLLAFLLFVSLPDGYVYRRWFLWLLPPLFVWDTFRYLIFFVFGSPEIQSLRPLVATPNFIILCVGVGAMIHRYRNRATPLQRQQFKWLFLGIIIEMLIILSNQLLQIGIQIFNAELPINFI
ncbi:MAG TPA: hypothetical protein PLZ51_12985, partial [Aggregatilineales bacterium]|nr:hypothetical protein [Aggregatilineales bacterium]